MKLFLILTLFLIIGCGRADGTRPGVDPSLLTGTWVAPCDDYGGEYLSISMDFSGSSMVQTIESFSQASCEIQLYSLATSHGVEIPGESSVHDDAYELDLTVTTTRATIEDEEISQNYEAQEKCEIDDWSTGSTVDLTASPAGCFRGDLPLETGTTIFTIARVDSETLVIGQNTAFNTGISVEQRHIQFSDTVYELISP